MMNEYFEKWKEICGKEFNSGRRFLPFPGEKSDDYLVRTTNSFRQRRKLVVQYSWAVPDHRAIEIIVKHGPVVELGAGTGYWALLAKSAGCDIIPYDISPPGEKPNKYGHTRQWTKIFPGDEKVLSDWSDRSLFLCWPPMGKLVEKALHNYAGNTIIYVGEKYDGCTGWSDEFDNWEVIEEHEIPQWDGVHDLMIVFRRR